MNSATRLALLLIICGALVGCGKEPPATTPPPKEPEQNEPDKLPANEDEHGAAAHTITAAAAGGSIDIEYIQPIMFDDQVAPKRPVFPAKFVCGCTESADDDWHVSGSYRTVINVLNMGRAPAKIQWVFTTFEEGAIDGATAELNGRHSMALPCEFILRQLALAGLDVSGVTEGFVLLEGLTDGTRVPDNAFQVSVVYEFLHKQRHDLPDLVPVKKDARYCAIDDERKLVVTIGNIGEEPAEASTARISWVGGPTVDRATPPLAPGKEAALDPVDLPGGEGNFVFTIIADHRKDVMESNELNNTAIGNCLIVE